VICSFDQLRDASLLWPSLRLLGHSVSEFETKRNWALWPSALGGFCLSIIYLPHSPLIPSSVFPLFTPRLGQSYTFGRCFWTSHIGGGSALCQSCLHMFVGFFIRLRFLAVSPFPLWFMFMTHDQVSLRPSLWRFYDLCLPFSLLFCFSFFSYVFWVYKYIRVCHGLHKEMYVL